MVGIFEARMLDEYRVPLRKWHGGSIPSTAVAETFAWGGIRPVRERYESWEGHDPATVSEYAMDYIGLTGIWGTGVEEFMWDLHELDRLRAQATQAWKDVADRELKLVERIETLCSAKN